MIQHARAITHAPDATLRFDMVTRSLRILPMVATKGRRLQAARSEQRQRLVASDSVSVSFVSSLDIPWGSCMPLPLLHSFVQGVVSTWGRLFRDLSPPPPSYNMPWPNSRASKGTPPRRRLDPIWSQPGQPVTGTLHPPGTPKIVHIWLGI